VEEAVHGHSEVVACRDRRSALESELILFMEGRNILSICQRTTSTSQSEEYMRFPDRSSEGGSAICSGRPSATKANSNTPPEIVASQASYEWRQPFFPQRDWMAARGSIHIRFGQGGHRPFLRPQKFCVPCGHRIYTYTRHHGSPRYQPMNAHSSTTILQQKPKITDPLRTFFRNGRDLLTSRKRSIPC
jgi:hypothetical protein